MIQEDGTHVMVTPSVLYSDNSAVTGLDGGNLGILTVRFDGMDSDENGTNRKVWFYRVLGQDHDEIGMGDDIQGPETDSALHAMRSLVSFLLACAESKSEESENYSLFPKPIREWAEMVSDELSIVSAEIDDELEELARRDR
jgi:hypothetical protein